jgi:phospholipid/cholesterol/gamma-HCH transport system substrate-binding protein
VKLPQLKPLHDRNQGVVAVVGTVLIGLLLVLATNLRHLPLVSNARTYHAELADAAGLGSGDDVRIAGITVGEVRDVELAGDRVVVTFTVDGSRVLGSDTTLDVKVASILGQVYVGVSPKGSGRLDDGATIPLARTTVPYTLLDVLGTLSTQTSQIDLKQLTAALSTLSDSLRNAPSSVGPLLDSLGKLSQTIASRSDQLATLTTSAQKVTATLSQDQAQLVTLLGDGDLVLNALNQRRAVVHSLLVDATGLSQQLSSLVTRDGGQLQPLLANLKSVTDVLVRDQSQLDSSIQLLGPFSRYVANATGSGTFLDLLTPTILIPDNELVTCANKANPTTGCPS